MREGRRRETERERGEEKKRHTHILKTRTNKRV